MGHQESLDKDAVRREKKDYECVVVVKTRRVCASSWHYHPF